MQATRLVALAGSKRQGSWNKMLVEEMAKLAGRLPGIEIEVLDLAEVPMPMYDGDLEGLEGVPESAHRLARALKSADGLILASPEYNASVSPLLKNALDWVSRTGRVLEGKPVLLVSASPGALGGLRGLGHLREVLNALGALVLPQQRALGRAHEIFDSEGQIGDQALQAELTHLFRSWPIWPGAWLGRLYAENS